MIVVLSILVALTLVFSFLGLSACGHALTGIRVLRADVAKASRESTYQARLSRKVYTEYSEKILRQVGWVPDPPTPLEKAMADLETGREPVIDFGDLGGKHVHHS